jgi:hypothetical protein
MKIISRELLEKIFYVINNSENRKLLQVSLYENLIIKFNEDIQNNKYPTNIILRSYLDDEIILLETLEKQNVFLDYLYSWFLSDEDKEYCEQIKYVKNAMNIVN